jgi:phosphoglycerate dehydrogenase-like enzyme
MTTILMYFNQGELAGAYLDQVKKIAPEVNVLMTQDPHQIEIVAEDIEVAMGWVPPELILSLPNLRWYQQWAAGIDWLLKYSKGVEQDFILTNGSGVHAICISEQIFAFLLAFARDLPTAYRAQYEGKWSRSTSGEKLFELAGKTMLLLGLGGIGSRTAQVAIAMGMRVIGIRRNPLVPVWGVEKIGGPDQLLEFIPEADVVVNALPHTRETEHLLSRKAIQQIKPGAYLISIGRGMVVDEAALIEALQSGAIAGAGLDVFETEPLPAASPLWKMKNVIITAHYAGATPNYLERIMAIFLDNLRRYQDGETLRNVVDKKLGY